MIFMTASSFVFEIRETGTRSTSSEGNEVRGVGDGVDGVCGVTICNR